jgi:hypothetical protein
VGQRRLTEKIIADCTREVLGGRTVAVATKTERDAIMDCAKEELAFILQREDATEAAPELHLALQEAADKARIKKG